MVDEIPGNFKNRYRYNEEGLNCSDCKVEMTQYLCTIFPSRASLREGLDMSSLDNAVVYFRRYSTIEKAK